ncbi:hypothetical protein [Bradyrhizobium sp. dw_78]|uniref:hypothetical protein n=1 Tax=Bradyrhizobium sp. dw_78 TaxID=2719793 RepID=UPI001BD459A5|nr:hypothetical protein [Bradyrhizobium sp. dw_78]
MSQPNVFWWQKYGTVGQIAQAAVALFGFIAILAQINVLGNNAHQAGARQIYQAYNDLEFKNPQYAKPDLDRLKAGPANDMVQYETFVSYFLYACEEAVAAFDKREWQATCDYDLKEHLPFLCEKMAREPAYILTYSAETQRWIAAELQKAGMTAPDCKFRKT